VPVLLAVVLAACSSKKATTDVAPRPPIDAPRPDGTPAATDASVAAVIPSEARLLLTSVAPDWDTIATEFAVYRRTSAAAPWQRVRTWRGTLGRTGLAWGRGLHGDGPPREQTGPTKREGDGKSPAGVFTLHGTYGYAAAPPPRATLPYIQVDASWRCVDDPASASYNRIVDEDAVAVDWTSAETMRRDDALYTWVIDVGHNRARHPGDGSCIFLHVWRGPTDPTAGCTAMPRSDIEALLAELDPAHYPTLVQLTAGTYDVLAPAWQLPARR
jgi:L,D-peptidoglycan transpeptidase YkuD (ErfK/YbiS/YcfS/YnhG family)